MPRRERLTVLRGRVATVFYSSARFTAGKLLTSSGENVSFVGPLFAKIGDYLVLKGTWVQHPRYGRQFKVKTLEIDQQLTPEGLTHYLANNPAFKGVGPKKAERIAHTFGKDFETVLLNEPKKIESLVGLSSETVQAIANEWTKNNAINQVVTWLSAFGLTHHQVTTLVNRLGNNALNVLKADPYMLIAEVRGMGFKKVDQIARRLGVEKSSETRIRAGVQYVLSEALEQGHCYLELNQLLDRANALLIMDVLDSRARIEKCVDQLIELRALTCDSHDERFLLADIDIHRMEHDLAKQLASGYKPNPHFGAMDAESVRQVAPTLNDGQRRAVVTALSSRIMLMCGGAGSGKTYTVNAIRRVYEDHGHQVVLCAPTGKAAKRLEQVVGLEASTIHRLLGYDGKVFKRGPDDPIEADVLIVDEVSMVDTRLAWNLFRTIDFEKTAVVLVGDHNQLPPVGPGNLVRDLIQSRAIPMVILDRVVRQAGILKENCIALLKGEVRKTSEVEPSGLRAWYLVNQFTDAMRARDFLTQLYREVFNERLGFDLVRDVQVLTPTHKGPLGTKELNILLQQLVQAKLFGVSVSPVEEGRRPKLYRHDKIIQTRNNYEIGVMNGAVGYVLHANPDGSLLIDFDGDRVAFEAGSPNLKDLQLAYALTIHKAQGSEYACAVVVVHKSHAYMHHRNLFYTGVTRARRSVVILGDRWGIQNCAQQRQVASRNTFLSYLLAGQT